MSRERTIAEKSNQLAQTAIILHELGFTNEAEKINEVTQVLDIALCEPKQPEPIVFHIDDLLNSSAKRNALLKTLGTAA